MINEKTLKRWNMTADECDKEIRKITVKGFRLTYDEKEELFFLIKENCFDADDHDALVRHLNYGRELAKEVKETEKKIRDFVKEWRRICMKYDGLNTDIEAKSIDELVKMWCEDYFELYFMEDKVELIEYYGAKNYAQLYCYNVGACPESEVKMWA